jgi:hypothetical protein
MSQPPNKTEKKTPSVASRILYQAALPAMPTGLVLWLIGMANDSYPLGVTGLLVLIAGGFIWQDDQHPAHPGN